MLVMNRTDTRPPLYVEPIDGTDGEDYGTDGLPDIIEVEKPDDDEEESGRIPLRTNFLFVGVDNQWLADAIIVGTFYRESGDIRFMSIPRDMVVRIPTHRMEQMRADGLRPPSILKVNELRSHGGRTDGILYLKDQISEMLGVEFDFHVEVDLPAFRRIVDAIGGVEMYIPQRMFYEGLDQNPPLRINVPAGLQLLNGEMAEGVVRYRLYPMGDLQRNAVQMEFMTLLIQQATTREALLNDPAEIIRTLLENVRSDIGMNAFLYIPYIPRVSADSVTTFTMPGSVGGVAISSTERREFFIPDTERLPAVISDIFYNVPETPQEDGEEEIEEIEQENDN